MKKKNIVILTVIGVVIVFLFCMMFIIKEKNQKFTGKLFQNSIWSLTWEELYEVSPTATEYAVNEFAPQIIISYKDKAAFNKDIEKILEYVMSKCGSDFYYGTQGAQPVNYISKPKNTGTYEEELSWISVAGEYLSIRLVRIGNTEDAFMKVIMECVPLKFVNGEVIISDNTKLIVKIDDVEVRLSWKYVTGKRYISETTPLFQVGDKVCIGILEDEEIQYYSGNEQPVLGMKYLEKLAPFYKMY